MKKVVKYTTVFLWSTYTYTVLLKEYNINKINSLNVSISSLEPTKIKILFR
jgi:hypothetical protein